MESTELPKPPSDSIAEAKSANDTLSISGIHDGAGGLAEAQPSDETDPSKADTTKAETEGTETKPETEESETQIEGTETQATQTNPQDSAAAAAEPTEEESNPTLARFMAACQEGQLDTVKELISSRQVAASDTFSLNVTALHWAAINNRLSVVKYLMENEHSVADANARGGNLNATPLHWACRNGLVYVVDYLLAATNADPTLKDSQQYNALHLAVHSSNITLVVYIILACVGQGPGKIYIDEPDSIQCTPLHWAAYQGDILSVNALIKYGADVNKCDKSLMTPLHWGFIRGYKPVLAALLAAGSDIHLTNGKGKDSFAVARDMNCEPAWHTVLKEADRDPHHNWEPYHHMVPATVGKLLTFLTPYVVLPVVVHLCSFSSGYALPKLLGSVAFTAVAVVGLQYLVIPTYMPQDTPIFKTPLLAGVFSATAFWSVATWLVTILPVVWAEQFLRSVVLAGAIALMSYCFFKAMFINPGFVPVPSDAAVVLAQVKELIRIGQFDTEHFCVNSFIRKPLRSKYSKISNRLVARFDHYCPWVYNDIGVRNHKLFVTYVYALVVAIVLYTTLSVEYFEAYAENLGYDSDLDDSCGLLSDELCAGYRNNPFVFNLTIWCWFQLVWLGFLAVVQTFQILKGLTTWEFGSINKRISNPVYNHSTVPRDFNGPDLAPASDGIPRAHGHSHGFGTIAKLLGLDQFVMTVKMALLSLFQKTNHSRDYHSLDSYDIPTDFGWKQNWLDFWFIGNIEWRNMLFLPIEGENNLNGEVVDYYKLYEYPAKNTGGVAV